jgi:hypothetical protein
MRTILKAMWWDSAVGCIVTLTLSLFAAPLPGTAQPQSPSLGSVF